MSQRPALSQHNERRVILLSLRHIAHHVSRCGGYEFEDVISSCDNVDVVAPFGARPRNRIARHLDAILGKDAQLIDGRIRVDRPFDLFFTFCSNPDDLRYVKLVEGLHDNCRRSVCVISELWPSMLPGIRERLQLLRRFDYVFVNLQAGVAPIEEATGRPCRVLPLGVDALRFCPFPRNPVRNIDVYSMGRRPAKAHEALMACAERGELFYVYDTTSDFQVIDPREHRILLANVIKRSRYFITYPAKFDAPLETEGRQEMGARYFEGAAGGSVMVGRPPRCTSYDDCFGWDGAVIPTSGDGRHIASLIAELEAQPQRIAQIRRTNVIKSLLCHDWVYRWRQILDCVGLPSTAKMAEREARLASLANLIGDPDHSLDAMPCTQDLPEPPTSETGWPSIEASAS